MYGILTVDDNRNMGKNVEQLLNQMQKSRFLVCAKACGEKEALGFLRERQMDMVIIDADATQIDPFSLLNSIKQESLCSMVAMFSRREIVNILHPGICVLEKPIDAKKLKTVLDQAEKFMDIIRAGQEYMEDCVEILANMALDGGTVTPEMAMPIAVRLYRGISKSGKEPYAETRRILEVLCAKIRQARPYLRDYVIFKDLVSVEKSDMRDEKAFGEFLCARFGETAREANKFAVHTRNEIVRSVCDYIVSNIERNKITLPKIAETFCISSSYLSHIFKAQTGVSFVDYVTRVKIERAKTLLKSQDIKIYEIAYCLGYEDAEYFNRVFKKLVGITATAYRAREKSAARKGARP